MKLYLVNIYSGEQAYFVVADNKKEAIKLVKDKYFKENDCKPTNVSIAESVKIEKGVIGNIDWTEPESPLFKKSYEDLTEEEKKTVVA